MQYCHTASQICLMRGGVRGENSRATLINGSKALSLILGDNDVRTRLTDV
jgi:hypothetical protein